MSREGLLSHCPAVIFAANEARQYKAEISAEGTNKLPMLRNRPMDCTVCCFKMSHDMVSN